MVTETFSGGMSKMRWNAIAPILIQAIKIVSTLLISGAIILETWNLITHFIDRPLPEIFKWVIIIERFALISHLIEAIIAGFSAQRQEKNPLRSGVYTFFVGTVGLWEVLKGVKFSFGAK
jgi:hypothetical protein